MTRPTLFKDLQPGDVFRWSGRRWQKLPLISRINERWPDNAIDLDNRQFSLFGGCVQVEYVEHRELENGDEHDAL